MVLYIFTLTRVSKEIAPFSFGLLTINSEDVPTLQSTICSLNVIGLTCSLYD